MFSKEFISIFICLQMFLFLRFPPKKYYCILLSTYKIYLIKYFKTPDLRRGYLRETCIIYQSDN